MSPASPSAKTAQKRTFADGSVSAARRTSSDFMDRGLCARTWPNASAEKPRTSSSSLGSVIRRQSASALFRLPSTPSAAAAAARTSSSGSSSSREISASVAAGLGRRPSAWAAALRTRLGCRSSRERARVVESRRSPARPRTQAATSRTGEASVSSFNTRWRPALSCTRRSSSSRSTASVSERPAPGIPASTGARRSGIGEAARSSQLIKSVFPVRQHSKTRRPDQLPYYRRVPSSVPMTYTLKAVFGGYRLRSIMLRSTAPPDPDAYQERRLGGGERP
jgi:hypothetical protein